MRTNKTILILTVCLSMLAIGTAIAAPNFVLLHSNRNVSCYLDPDTLTYDGTILNCWLKLEMDERPFVVNYLFNSKTKQMKAIKQRTYDGNDNLIKEEPINQAWEPIDEENMIIYKKVMEHVKN